MFWSCPPLANFWEDICNTLSVALRVHQTHLLHYLGFPYPYPYPFPYPSLSILQLSKMKKDVIAFDTWLARSLILLRWKSSVTPAHVLWVQAVLNCIKFEKN